MIHSTKKTIWLWLLVVRYMGIHELISHYLFIRFLKILDVEFQNFFSLMFSYDPVIASYSQNIMLRMRHHLYIDSIRSSITKLIDCNSKFLFRNLIWLVALRCTYDFICLSNHICFIQIVTLMDRFLKISLINFTWTTNTKKLNTVVWDFI